MLVTGGYTYPNYCQKIKLIKKGEGIFLSNNTLGIFSRCGNDAGQMIGQYNQIQFTELTALLIFTIPILVFWLVYKIPFLRKHIF